MFMMQSSKEQEIDTSCKYYLWTIKRENYIQIGRPADNHIWRNNNGVLWLHLSRYVILHFFLTIKNYTLNTSRMAHTILKLCWFFFFFFFRLRTSLYYLTNVGLQICFYIILHCQFKFVSSIFFCTLLVESDFPRTFCFVLLSHLFLYNNGYNLNLTLLGQYYFPRELST